MWNMTTARSYGSSADRQNNKKLEHKKTARWGGFVFQKPGVYVLQVFPCFARYSSEPLTMLGPN